LGLAALQLTDVPVCLRLLTVGRLPSSAVAQGYGGQVPTGGIIA